MKIRSLVFTASVFSTLLIALIWYQILHGLATDKEKTIRETVQKNANLVISLEQYAITTIRNGDALLQMLKMNFEHHGMQLHVDSMLDNRVIDKGSINGVAIIDDRGRLVKSDLPQTGNQLNFADRDYFVFHKTINHSVFISKPFFSRMSDRAVIVLSRRITKKDGSFGGVVAVQLEPSTFTKFYINARLRPDDIISLIAPDGTTYARRTGNKESFGENIIRSPLFTHLKTRPEGNYFAKDAIRFVPTYFSYRKLKDYPIIATVGTAEKDVLADHKARAVREYLFGGTITLLVLVFMVFVILNSRHRIKNLKRIKDAEVRYRSIFENSQDAIITSLSNGRVEAVNPAAIEMFGIDKERRTDIWLTELFSDTEPPVTIGESQVDMEMHEKKEVLFTRADKTVFTGELVYSRYRDEIGNERFIVLIRDISLRKQMERRLLSEQKNFERMLTIQIIQAQEREREIIGHELHDNVNQILTTVKLYLEMVVGDPRKGKRLLPESIKYLVKSINEIRNLSRDLSAPTLGNQSLIDSIKDLVSMVESSTALKIKFYYNQFHDTIPKDRQLALYRILQEQLNNVIKHSGASEVEITLSRNDEVAELMIFDNGKGFQATERKNGIGLNNIQSRAQLLGGKMEIRSAPGEGVLMKITLPAAVD
jgi:PAS domain S-box-containing protein